MAGRQVQSHKMPPNFCVCVSVRPSVIFTSGEAGRPLNATTQPPMVCKMEGQLEYIHNAHTFLHVWRRFVCSVGALTKISALELNPKFIKSPLLVGMGVFMRFYFKEEMISTSGLLLRCISPLPPH